MDEISKNNITKVYCAKCDSIFGSRKKFEKHLDEHNSRVSNEVCPIDTAFSKFANLFKKKSSNNLE